MRLIFIFSILLISAPLYCSNVGYNFKNYGVNLGLPSTQIYQINQDLDGNIWFGTDRGLVCYNGYEFRTYTIADGLSTNVIFHSCFDEQGHIWCMGEDWKINYFTGTKFVWYDLDPITHEIEQIHSDLQDMKIVGDRMRLNMITELNNSAFEIDRSGKVYYLDTLCGIHIQSKPGLLNISHKIRSSPDKEYNVYFNGEMLSANFLLSQEFYGYSLKTIVSLNYDNKVLFSYYNGLYEISLQKEKPIIKKVKSFDNVIYDIKRDQEGNIYVAGYKIGLWKFPAENWSDGEQMLSDLSISNVFLDRNQGIWVGSLFNGLFYCDNQKIKQLRLPSETGVSYLTGTDSSLFCLSTNSKVYSINQDNILPLKSSSLNLTDFILDRDDRYFLFGSANSGNCVLLDKENQTVDETRIYSSDFFKVKNMIYSVSRTSIDMLDSNWFSLKKYYCEDKVLCAQTNNEENCLIGTSKGLFKFYFSSVELIKKNELVEQYTIKTENLENYNEANSFFQSKIRDIYFVNDSLRIFASDWQGCYIENFEGKNYHLTKKDGLISNSINKIYVNGDFLVLMTPEGMSVISQKGGIANYTVKNGLISNAVTAAFIRNDTIWVGTDLGISILPLVSTSDYDLDVHLTSILVNDEAIPIVRSALELDHSEDQLSISFESISYPQSGQINYRYLLNGVDQEWVNTQNRTVRYTNLPSGEFSFLVSVQNPDRSWSPPFELVHLVKFKPFWQKMWFFILTILEVILLFVGVSYLFYRRQKRIQRDKMNVLDLQRKTLQAQMNPHFIFNALTSLQNLILKDRKPDAALFLTNFSKLTRLSLMHSSQNIIPLAEDLNAIKLYMELEIIRYGNNFNYDISVELDDQNMLIPPMLIQPFVENAIIHGFSEMSGDGRIQIKIRSHTPQHIICTVQDNGKGRKKEFLYTRKSKSMGISLTKDRLKILGIENGVRIYDLVANEKPIGTKVEIIIPIQNIIE